MNFRRLIEADASKVHTFLDKLVQEDPASGMIHAPDEDFLAAQVSEGIDSWVAFEGKKLVGILGPVMWGIRGTKDGKERTFCLFNRLAVDHTLYTTSRSETIRIARELTLAAADDIKADGKQPDDICVQGPTNSRGASWTRLLKFEEIRRGPESIFWLPFKLIWERAHATESL